MQDVYVIGVGMTEFGKRPDESIKTLSKTAITRACEHAGITPKDIETGLPASTEAHPS